MKLKFLVLALTLNLLPLEGQTSMEAKKILDAVAEKMSHFDNQQFNFTYVLNNRQ